MPTTYSGKAPQTSQDYSAARQADRFFCDVKGKAEGIKYLADAQCFGALVDAVELLNVEMTIELARRDRARVQQLELEGLLTASDRSAINQAEFRLSR